LLGGGVNSFLHAEIGVNIVDEEVELNVELHFHGLGIFGSHRERDVLVKFGHKLLPGAFVEKLYA